MDNAKVYLFDDNRYIYQPEGSITNDRAIEIRAALERWAKGEQAALVLQSNAEVVDLRRPSTD